MGKTIYKNKDKKDDELIDEKVTALIIAHLLNDYGEDIEEITSINLKEFAVFKNFHNRQDLINLVKANPKITFEEFILKADPINQAFNKTWLTTELNFVKESASFKHQWDQFKKDNVKNLKWVTVGDDKVRYSHSLLNGIVKPIDDEFWTTHQVPYDWNCRCKIIATDEDVTNSIDLKNIQNNNNDDNPDYFKNNIGVSGLIFNDKHPYFLNVSDSIRKKLLKLASNY